MSLKFRDEVTGAHHGQTDHQITAFDSDEFVGYLTYSIYQGRVHVNMIEVPEESRSVGYGKAIVKELIDKYGYGNINWGYASQDGERLMKGIHKEMQRDEKEDLVDSWINGNKKYVTSIIAKSKPSEIAEFVAELSSNYGHDETIWLIKILKRMEQ